MDWSQLPSDLLEKIAGTLDEDIADRIRFSAVCKPWQSALQSATDLPRLRLPWLLSSSRSSFSDPYVLRVFSLPETKAYTLPLRKTRRGYIFAAHRDFFLTASRRETSSLLNPITRARIPLPSLLPIGPNTHSAVERCKLIDGHEMLVVMIALSYGNILCCRQIKSIGAGGEDVAGEWTLCGGGDDNPPFENASDFTCYRGRYFVLDEKESTTSIFDPDTSRVVSVIPSVGTDRRYLITDRFSYVRRRYLVESSSREMLFLVIAPSRTGKERFEVFELDETEQQLKWSKVNSIGNDTLFLDSDRAMALPATEYNGYRGNCIIFLNYEEEDMSSQFSIDRAKVNGLSSFDIGNDRVEKLLCLDTNVWGDEDVVWFVPGL